MPRWDCGAISCADAAGSGRFRVSLDLNFLGSTAGAWWVFWVAVAGWLIFLGLDPLRKTGSRRGTAQEELLRRLKAGEISREDYERRLRLLGEDPSQSR